MEDRKSKAISGFRCDGNEICAFTVFYAAKNGNSVPTLRDKHVSSFLKGPVWTFKMELIGFPEKSVRICYSKLRKIKEEWRRQVIQQIEQSYIYIYICVCVCVVVVVVVVTVLIHILRKWELSVSYSTNAIQNKCMSYPMFVGPCIVVITEE